ncbi:MAG: TRAP transporter substrate-binding protein DctP [Clostridiales Family XIII bacterium]|nr:TRAP transporter substrate-binding protein DctP [Clostridiales Family XIII bacterium]
MKKHRIRPTLIPALAAALIVVLAACGGGAAQQGEGGAVESEAEESAAGQIKVAELDTAPNVKSIEKFRAASANMPDLPEPTIAPVPDGVDPNRKWELTFNDHLGSDTQQGLNEQQLFEHIKARTNGQVVITPHFNATLLDTGNIFAGVAQGIADISVYNVDMNPGAQVAHVVFNLPQTMETPKNYDMSRIYRKFVNTHPVFEEENLAKGVTWISTYACPINSFHSTGGDIRTPGDLNGRKVIANARLTEYLKAGGASGLVMGPGEWYTSLQKGVANTQIGHWAVIDDMKLLELYKSNTMLGSEYGGVSVLLQGWIVNAEVWDSIPEAYRAVIVEEFDWAGDAASIYNDDFYPIMVKQAEDAGQNVIMLTGDELDPFYELSRAAAEAWYDEAKANGFADGASLHEELSKAIADRDM